MIDILLVTASTLGGGVLAAVANPVAWFNDRNCDSAVEQLFSSGVNRIISGAIGAGAGAALSFAAIMLAPHPAEARQAPEITRQMQP